ncbi:MAG: hypothetical protein G01um101431_686 [Parcubacteria group bacterium Gr01-1014_31]|nr:MAG: hypothetical protein G01um101431_686 [Parcubacteria group bacterium Gr01-1014_31]
MISYSIPKSPSDNLFNKKDGKKTPIVSILSLLVSFGTLVFVFYNYFFLERAQIGLKDYKVIRMDDEGKTRYQITYKLSNYGKVSASDVSFKIYAMTINDDSFKKMIWSDSIVSIVVPGADFPFGVDTLDFSPDNLGKSMALIFDFEFNDTMFSRRKSQLWFRYQAGTVGDNVLFYLLESERDKIMEKYKELKTTQ